MPDVIDLASQDEEEDASGSVDRLAAVDAEIRTVRSARRERRERCRPIRCPAPPGTVYGAARLHSPNCSLTYRWRLRSRPCSLARRRCARSATSCSGRAPPTLERHVLTGRPPRSPGTQRCRCCQFLHTKRHVSQLHRMNMHAHASCCRMRRYRPHMRPMQPPRSQSCCQPPSNCAAGARCSGRLSMRRCAAATCCACCPRAAASR